MGLPRPAELEEEELVERGGLVHICGQVDLCRKVLVGSQRSNEAIVIDLGLRRRPITRAAEGAAEVEEEALDFRLGVVVGGPDSLQVKLQGHLENKKWIKGVFRLKRGAEKTEAEG